MPILHAIAIAIAHRGYWCVRSAILNVHFQSLSAVAWFGPMQWPSSALQCQHTTSPPPPPGPRGLRGERCNLSKDLFIQVGSFLSHVLDERQCHITHSDIRPSWSTWWVRCAITPRYSSLSLNPGCWSIEQLPANQFLIFTLLRDLRGESPQVSK